MATKASISKQIGSAAKVTANTSSMPDNIDVYNPDYGKMAQQAQTDASAFLSKFNQQQQPVSQGQSAPDTSSSLRQVMPSQQPAQKSILDTLSDIKQRDLQRTDEKQAQQSQIAPAVQSKEIDHDNEPYGFDHSDKMSMLGALGVSGAVGAAEMLARSAQLTMQAGAKGLLNIPGQSFFGEGGENSSKIWAGANKDFTDWFNRDIERSKLYEDAQHAHPITSLVGNIAGNIAVGGPLFKGVSALFKGEELTGAALDAVKAAATAAESAGAKDGVSSLMTGLVNNSAAKAITNAKTTSIPLKLAKWTGEGATIGASQYDPDNNNLLSNMASAAVSSLAIPFGAKLIKAAGKPLGDAASTIMDKFGITVPAKPALLQMAKYLPFTGYGKMIKDWSTKLTDAAKGMKEGITETSDKGIASDLDSRINKINDQLSAGGLDEYTHGNLAKDMSNLMRQRDQLGSKSGYSQYLFGNTEKSLGDTRAEISQLNTSINDDLATSPNIDITRTADASSKISKNIKEMNAASRRPALLNITNDLIDKAQNPQEKALFNSLGITDPEAMSDMVEDYLNGDLYKNNKYAYKVIKAYAKEIRQDLENQGQLASGVDATDPIHALSDKSSLTYEAFRGYRTLLGQKMETAPNSVEKGYYKLLYRHATEDLRDHISQYGKEDTMDKFNRQNYLRSNIIEPLSKLVDKYSNGKDKMADTFIGEFLKPDEPNNISTILSKMGNGEDTSKMALKAAVLHEAWDRTHIPGVGINPLKFINEALKLGETNKAIFSPEEFKVFKGFQEFAGHISQIAPEALTEGTSEGLAKTSGALNLAKKYGAKASAYSILGGSALALGPGVLLPLALASYSFGKLVTTTKGRDLMARIADLPAKAGSKVNQAKAIPIVNDIFKHLGFYSQIVSAIAGTKINMSGEGQ